MRSQDGRRVKVPSAGRYLIYTCEICGEPASFSVGANISDALKYGKVELAGKWYCRPHLPGDYFAQPSQD